MGKSGREAYKEARQQLEKLGLADAGRTFPELSGGTKSSGLPLPALGVPTPHSALSDEPTASSITIPEK